jgi:hypothetical protein
VTPAPPGRASTGSAFGPSQSASSPGGRNLDSFDRPGGIARRGGECGGISPFDEEREAWVARRLLEAGHAPLDPLAARRRPRAGDDDQAESRRRAVEIAGAYRPAEGPQAAAVRCARHPASEDARTGELLVDDGDELDVGRSERHDAIGRAPVGVSPADRGLEPVRLLEKGCVPLEITPGEQDVIELHGPVRGPRGRRV